LLAPPWIALAIPALLVVGCNAIFGLDELRYEGTPVGGASPVGGTGPVAGAGGGAASSTGGTTTTSSAGGHSAGGHTTAAGGTGGAAGCELGPFSAPQNLAAVNSTADDLDPWLSGDGLSLYVSTFRTGGAGGSDLWVASRQSTSSPFSSIAPVVNVNSTADDAAAAGTPDTLLLVFASARTGTLGLQDLMFATRQQAGDEFGAPAFLTGLNSSSHDSDPALTADGLLLCYSTDRSSGWNGRDIWCATRATASSSFGDPEELTDVTSTDSDTDPCLSGDGLTIFFSSTRDGGSGGSDIWTASRLDRSLPFGAATRVAELCSTSNDWGAALSADGMTIYFASDRAGGVGLLDVWVATRSCLGR
jgi:Tol biopolymer transport system component